MRDLSLKVLRQPHDLAHSSRVDWNNVASIRQANRAVASACLLCAAITNVF